MEAAVDPLVRQGHRQLRAGGFFIEAGLHLLVWAGVVAGFGLDGAVAVVGAVPAVLVLSLASDLRGGSVVRRTAGFRLVDAATGGRATPLAVLRHQLWRIAGLSAAETLVGGSAARGYDGLQRRPGGAAVVGRPTSAAAIATFALGAVVAAAGVLVGRAGTDDAWAFLAVMAVPLAAFGAVVALTGAASLYRQPPTELDDDVVSTISAPGPAVAGDPNLRAAGMLAPVVGQGGYDPEPVPRTRLDGTETEVLDGTGPFVTRKRRRTGEVVPPER